MAQKKAGKHRQQDDSARESRRILDRVERESEKVGSSSMVRTANKVRDHFMGEEVPQADPIEILGKRIARGLAIIVFVALAYSLFVNYIAP